jgi:cyclic-di-GMP-binding protein
MADSSFDIVSEVDHMEVDNAFNQTEREIATRFDFKNTGTKIEKSGAKFVIEAETEERAKAALDVFKEKLVKRQVSLKHLNDSKPELSGKIFRISIEMKEGLSTENAKLIAKIIRDSGPKSVKSAIQGETLRVTSKSRDDLQEVIALIKGQNLEFAVQFTNYR